MRPSPMPSPLTRQERLWGFTSMQREITTAMSRTRVATNSWRERSLPTAGRDSWHWTCDGDCNQRPDRQWSSFQKRARVFRVARNRPGRIHHWRQAKAHGRPFHSLTLDEFPVCQSPAASLSQEPRRGLRPAVQRRAEPHSFGFAYSSLASFRGTSNHEALLTETAEHDDIGIVVSSPSDGDLFPIAGPGIGHNRRGLCLEMC